MPKRCPSSPENVDIHHQHSLVDNDGDACEIAPSPGAKRFREVLDAACAEFCAKGYDATTMKDIAERVGILKGSMYHYISSKEDLLYQIILDVHRSALELMSAIEHRNDDIFARLDSLIAEMAAFNIQNIDKAAVFFNDFRSLNPERRREIHETRQQVQDLVVRLIAEAQERGSVRKALSPQIIASGILGMLNSLHHWYRPEFGQAEVAEQITAFVAAGLRYGEPALVVSVP